MCGTHGRGEKSLLGFVGKRQRGRPRHRWEDGIRIDLGEIGWGGGVEWIQLAQDRDQWWAVMNVVMNLQVLPPWN
jgi:hypothetical protein